MMHKWELSDSPACDCGDPHQTMIHLTDYCPIRRFPGGIQKLNEVSKESIVWLENFDIRV